MKAYFSMPISNYDIKERKEHADNVKKILLDTYDEVITPFDCSPYDPNKPYGQCMKECITALMQCDVVVFDQDWYTSNGCRIEAEVARGCEIKMETI